MNPLDDNNHIPVSVITFNITDNMKNAGISELLLNKEFIIKFNDGGICSASFSRKTDSPSKINKRITQVLKNRLEQEHKVAALQDIERQLIERHDEIFPANGKSGTNNEFDDYKKLYVTRVTKLREQHIESQLSYKQWQRSVAEKYKKLKEVTEKNFPDAWPLLRFCLAVKSILNIYGCTLPFMGVILAIPSSMKTLVIQLFRKYPHSLYSDNFTPNSFESHNAALSEERLQEIDLLPKLRNKLFLTPELAPIFTTNEDDLRKTFGINTRILDGHGLETDSGAQGHRRYGNTFFVWIGAAVEVPYRVWQLLGTLGHKIYFFRPVIPEKTIDDLEKIAKDNKFQDKFTETEDALLDYLIEIDSAPECSNIRVDENGIVKVKWVENKGGVQDEAINCIAQVANLLKRLRGTVYISISKARTRRYTPRCSSENNEDNANDKDDQVIVGQDSNFFNVDESDYDTDYPIVEDASRAVVTLRNLAIANGISQGRDYINLEDISLIINVALSTTMKARSELVRVLLKKGGELTTSTIVKENKISSPFAKRTMRELAALGIVDISPVGRYNNSELKITLKEEYSWFKGDQFKELLDRHKIIATLPERCDEDENQGTEVAPKESKSNLLNDDLSQSHSELNSTGERHIKNSGTCDNFNKNKISDYFATSDENNGTITECLQSYSLDSISHRQSNLVSSDNSEGCNKDVKFEEKNDTPLRGSEIIQHVTALVSHTHARDEMMDFTIKSIIEKIRILGGSIVSIDKKLREVYDEHKKVRSYLGNKLTQRESRKVQKIYSAINNYGDNIRVVKTRPQITVQWVDLSNSALTDTS